MAGDSFSGDILLIASILLAAVILLLFLVIRMSASMRRMGRERDAGQGGRQPVEFVVDTFHDLVTKLKEKERELEALRSSAESRAERSESYSRNVIESVPSGVITFDESGNIVTVNRAAAGILGVGADDLVGRPADALGPAISAFLKDADQPETVLRREETDHLAADGRRLRLGFFTSRLRDANGRGIGTILGFTDLTEVRHLRQKIELRERLSHLGEVSAGIAHELRNPMAVIAGYARMLDQAVSGNNAARSAVSAIRKEVDGMNRVITEFLQFARPADMNASPLVDMNALIHDAADSALAGNDGMTFDFNIGDGSFVSGDEILLRQAMLNLFRNAIEAITVDGDTRGVVSVSTRCVGNELEIRVSNPGEPIPDELLERIFLPFVTTKEGGTGLGLAIAHKVVVMHDGTIEARSGGGKTEFAMRLPRSPD
ncbi:MAG: PAS domain S-box protein [Nitrospirae bacterium]|nr:PAS domain S-box protein [Nitrospirota bacterium]